MEGLGMKKKDPLMKDASKILEYYQSLQNSKKVKENNEKEKNLSENSKYYS